MLGSGRPFVVEISKPKKRTIDLKKIADEINIGAKDKVEVSQLRYSSRDIMRKLKKAENAQKEYRVLIGFQNEITDADIQLIEEKLNGNYQTTDAPSGST